MTLKKWITVFIVLELVFGIITSLFMFFSLMDFVEKRNFIPDLIISLVFLFLFYNTKSILKFLEKRKKDQRLEFLLNTDLDKLESSFSEIMDDIELIQEKTKALEKQIEIQEENNKQMKELLTLIENISKKVFL
jgi:hypothetical protein